MQDFDSTKYFMAETQKKVLFIPNLSTMLNALNLQTLKLPHEIMPDGANTGTGTTYADIEKSIINGVKIVYAQLKPLRVMMSANYINAENEDISKPKDFDEACDMVGWIYALLDASGYLNDRMVDAELPDDEEFGDEIVEEADG